jgi:hypothetical protein
MGTFRHLESVGFGVQAKLSVPIDLSGLDILLIPHITDPLVEKQRENIPFPIGAIYSRSA